MRGSDGRRKENKGKSAPKRKQDKDPNRSRITRDVRDVIKEWTGADHFKFCDLVMKHWAPTNFTNVSKEIVEELIPIIVGDRSKGEKEALNFIHQLRTGKQKTICRYVYHRLMDETFFQSILYLRQDIDKHLSEISARTFIEANEGEDQNDQSGENPNEQNEETPQKCEECDERSKAVLDYVKHMEL